MTDVIETIVDDEEFFVIGEIEAGDVGGEIASRDFEVEIAATHAAARTGDLTVELVRRLQASSTSPRSIGSPASTMRMRNRLSPCDSARGSRCGSGVMGRCT